MAEKKYAINPKEVEIEYQELAARMNYDGSMYLPRIFKKAFTLEQARLGLEFYTSTEEIASTLGISKEEVEADAQKYQVEAIAKKLNLDKEAVDKHIRYMFELGYAFPTRRGWKWARGAAQLRDSQTNVKFDEQLGDEYFDLWKAFERIEEYPTQTPESFALVEEVGPIFRVLPALKSFKDIPDIITEDNFGEVIKKAATVAVAPCACKRLVRDRDPNMPTEVCIICDRVAEHNIRRGAARVISVEEAVDIHNIATEAGLICLPQSNEVAPPMICHCHWTCCVVITPTVMMDFPIRKKIASSCYQAVVDPDKCIGCQTCITRCQVGAIEMKRYSGAGKQEKLKAWVDPDKCLGCGLCVIKCPAEARTMVMVKTSESIPKERIAPPGYTAVQEYKRGKHLDDYSVVTRPYY